MDGAAFFPAVVDAVRRARSHVHLAAWALSPSFLVERGDRHQTLRELLAEAAQRVDVRVVLWAGSPLPLARPWRSDARTAVAELTRDTRIQVALDRTGLLVGACHEKVVVVDDREAFVGGIDPTNLKGDRYDQAGHPARSGVNWHDLGAHLRGPAVADVADHFRQRWQDATGRSLPPAPAPPPAGHSAVQIVRTVPERAAVGRSRPDFSALQAHLAALRGAQRLVYLENQFLWSVEVVDVLADKLRHPPHESFRVLAVLPAHPMKGIDDTRGQLRVLAQADAGAGRLLACTLRSRSAAYREDVYVHAKVLVVDDAWLSVGSMNLSDHGLFNAVEVQLITDDAALARATRIRLWSEHLELPEATVAASDAVQLIDEHWRPVAQEQLARQREGRELTRRVVVLPAASRRPLRVLGPLQGLVLGT